MRCFGADTALAFVDGKLPEQEASAIEAHVAGCADCRALIVAVVRGGDGGEAASGAASGATTDTGPAASASDDGPTAPRVIRGTLIGRYLVLEEQGRGGMGEVYQAYDPELERQVALKLVRPGRVGPRARDRLLREARALAQLAHPNVVAVHDAGTWGDQVFVAMELVLGKTLKRWLRDARPDRRAILEAMSAAGRGLAAAHAAGLVHRDFKPDNVIVGDDGRVRVLDFGLARAGTREESADGDDERTNPAASPARSPAGSTQLTLPGAAVGTPAYMAPEQRAAAAVNARSDQYAFCVTLREALTGQHPDPVRRPADTRTGRDAELPGWLRRVIERGLDEDPARRHPSMTALLAALAADPAARRRRIAAAAGALALVAAAIAGSWALAARRQSRCGGARLALGDVWDASARRRRVERGLRGASAGVGEEVWQRVAPALDGWAERWSATHREACEARVRGEQSAEVLDLRMACLERRRREVAALVEQLAHADAALLDQAVPAVGALTTVAACGDVDALRSPVPLPADPAARAQVGPLQAELARATALRWAGRFDEGLAIAGGVVDAARRLGYRPLYAEALLEQAELHAAASHLADAERFGEEALTAGYGARHHAVVVGAASLLGYVLGVMGDRYPEAHRHLDLGSAALEALGGDDLLAARLAQVTGGVLSGESRFDEAQLQLERAYQAQRRLHPDGSYEVAWAEMSLGLVRFYRGDYDGARPALEEAYRMAQRTAGPRASLTGKVALNVAVLHIELGELAEAEKMAAEAVDILFAAQGPSGAVAAKALFILAIAHDEQGKHAEARAEYERVLAIQERVLGPSNPQLVETLQSLAVCDDALGDPAGALAQYERALGLERAAGRPRSHLAAHILLGACGPLMKLGRHDEAIRGAEEAVSIFTELLGPESAKMAEALTILGRAQLEAGRPAVAAPILRRALGMMAHVEIAEERRAEAQFRLALALWAQPPAREEARALARSARAGFERSQGSWRAQVAVVDAWLAKH